MEQDIKTSIVPIDKIPENLNQKNRTLPNTKNYAKHIYKDLMTAYNNHIETFEFVGDYHFTSFSSYVKAPVEQLTKEIILPGLVDEIVAVFKGKMGIDLTHTPILIRLTHHINGFNTFIKIVGITGTDRKHVYGKINFNYRKELKLQIIEKINRELANTPIDKHPGFKRYTKVV